MSPDFSSLAQTPPSSSPNHTSIAQSRSSSWTAFTKKPPLHTWPRILNIALFSKLLGLDLPRFGNRIPLEARLPATFCYTTISAHLLSTCIFEFSFAYIQQRDFKSYLAAVEELEQIRKKHTHTPPTSKSAPPTHIPITPPQRLHIIEAT